MGGIPPKPLGELLDVPSGDASCDERTLRPQSTGGGGVGNFKSAFAADGKAGVMGENRLEEAAGGRQLSDAGTSLECGRNTCTAAAQPAICCTVSDGNVALVACAELLTIGNAPAVLDTRKALERRGGESMSITTAGDRVTLDGVETNGERERRSEMVYAEGTCGKYEAMT